MWQGFEYGRIMQGLCKSLNIAQYASIMPEHALIASLCLKRAEHV